MERPRVLIVYGTGYGQTAKIAKQIGDRLADRGCLIDERYGKHLTLDRPLVHYDGVLVGASIYVNQHQSYIVEFARAHAPYLAEMPTGFFSVSLTAAAPTDEGRRQAHAALERFVGRTGWRPGMMMAFAGALTYSRYGLLETRIMQAIAAMTVGDTDISRDYEYTDWEEVRAFAEAYFETLGVEVQARPLSEDESTKARRR
ncbi:MAG: flavodoxin domain-containing protein [Bradymonadaceae bacterium]